MPHLLLERYRDFGRDFDYDFRRKLSFSSPSSLGGKHKRKPSDFPYTDLVLGSTEMFANCIFIVGSVCFLPQYADNLSVFLAGCILFCIGAALYVVSCSFCAVESYMHNRRFTMEFMESMLYIIGSWIFLLGTVLYWPRASEWPTIYYIQGMTLGSYFNLFTPSFEGSMLFILGSAIFGFATFTNALNHRNYEGTLREKQLMTAITTVSMAADMLFIGGSVAFLPDMGCGHGMIRFGAWMFIIGSSFFVLASFLTVYRTLRKWKDAEEAAAAAIEC